MTFDELSKTLSETVATGRIGTPVSLRLHLQMSNPQADLIGVLAAAINLSESTLDFDPVTLLARQDVSGGQLNLLLNCAAGRTMLLTIGRGSTRRALLHLLLIGNHGVVRLEGAELFEEESVLIPANRDRWATPIESSLVSESRVSL